MSQISLKCCLCYIIKAFHPNPIPADLIPLLIPRQNVCNFNLKSCFFIFNMSLIFILSLLNCVRYYIWAQMGFHDMFSSPFSCIWKREGVLCWPITERSNANTVILPSSFLTAFSLLVTGGCWVTNMYVERERRQGIFFLGINRASDLYQVKEPF